MQGRTFFRILINNLFVDNSFCKAIIAVINFCKEQSGYKKKELKFLKKMPLNNVKQQKIYEKRFIFDSKKTTGVSLK